MGGLPQLKGFILSTPRKESVIELSSTFDTVRFSEDKIPRNKSGRQCLYIPSASNFKGWDCILHLPGLTPTIVFIQVSKSRLRKHDLMSGKFRMQASVTGSTCRFLYICVYSLGLVDFYCFPDPSFVAQLITGITGSPCTTSLTNGALSVQSKMAALTVRFVYVTAKTKQSIRTGEGQIGKETPKYSNLIVIAKEDCESIFKLKL